MEFSNRVYQLAYQMAMSARDDEVRPDLGEAIINELEARGGDDQRDEAIAVAYVHYEPHPNVFLGGEKAAASPLYTEDGRLDGYAVEASVFVPAEAVEAEVSRRMDGPDEEDYEASGQEGSDDPT